MKNRLAVPALPLLVVMAVSSVCAVEQVPSLDVNSSCRAEAAVAPEGKKQCLQDEQDARAVLVQRWGQFSVADRQQCTAMATMGGTASYVELLTCLQMASDARKLPRNDRQ